MKTAEMRDSDPPFWDMGLLGSVVLALVLYVGSYFLVVRPGASVWFTSNGMKILTLPSYRGLPPKVFAPMHYVDRTWLRPGVWGSGRVWVVRGQTGVVAVGSSPTNLTWKVTPGWTIPQWKANPGVVPP